MCYDPLRFILCFLVCKPKLQDRACSLGTVTKQENCEQKKYFVVLCFMSFAFVLDCLWFVLAFLLFCICFCFFSSLSSLLFGFFVFVFFVFFVFEKLNLICIILLVFSCLCFFCFVLLTLVVCFLICSCAYVERYFFIVSCSSFLFVLCMSFCLLHSY